MRGLPTRARWLNWLRRDAVSRDWLRDQERRQLTQGEESVCWRWPVRKLFDESPIWNRSQMAKQKREAA